MKAILLLANGQIFEGESLGMPGTTIGEVVFATGMVGFEETLTDPSYYGQIITQTYPLIGNYGMNSQDKESGRVWARGYIVREACTAPSNFRCEMTLDAFLKDNGVVGIQGLDTRRLTRVLRESGVMNGAITTEYDKMDEAARADLMARIQGYAVTDAVVSVTCEERTEHNIGGAPHVALLDFGCKANILRCLVKRGCHVTVLPSTTTPEELAALAPDGLMLSNGPGDPAENVDLIARLRVMLDSGIPTFGICLGHQLTALAAGAATTKLKYGHRGANQPVTQVGTHCTYITSQNHGYAVVGESLPAQVGEVSHVNANDGTCEGVQYSQWNCFTVQFHPEACGGPRDTEFLFDTFIQRINESKEDRHA